MMAVSVFAYTAEDAPLDADQGWTPVQKQQWYTLSQGSRLIPLAWLNALEQSDSRLPLLDRSHTERFRYLADASADPAPLPVGFAIDTQPDHKFSVTKLRWKKGQSDQEPWVGMNCAACHTNELTFQGKRLRIEGAPALADFQGYLRSLNAALVATRSDASKMDRFAGKVLLGADTPANRRLLDSALATLVTWQSQVEQANATDLEYGFGRLDAFGHIFNKVLLRTEGSDQPRNPSDAPVSYPFLWNIHQHDRVQWNGMVANRPIGNILDIGALGRNVGEVTGVFADLTLLKPGPAIGGYRTSARLDHLLTLEQQIAMLKPPAWPDAFGPINADKWEAGQRLFDRAANGTPACSQCHAVLKRDDLTTPVVASMAPLSGAKPIGTDPWMACNAYTYQANTGLLRRTPKKFFPIPGFGVFGETEPLSDLLGATVIGSIYFKRKELGDGVADDLRGWLTSTDLYGRRVALSIPDSNIRAGQFPASLAQALSKDERLRRCMNETSQVLAYKGRPLGGIWATPPYLHNGSVPTLYDLLLPASQRPATFLMGTREFDPLKVGLVTGSTPENTFVFRTRDAAGSLIAGNSNLGHDYGNARLTDEERWALVEYMKAVGGTRVGDRVVP
ncbi:di-heme-cytochrome C peroxidase [Massilia sp. R2A-15]|uniref:di-heme-cytochrome C peroxidase n=1 Tax=Massilia sp. R2A-15 TaxID=3064278 RepID=UPI0027336C08|nr:di-heme-cytochrome C peroxidase [Massilia sp. R2A-15]WLI91797.1 di-heme-cytochrome C peroxidase [Massilia sp. R2A-15]